MRYCTHSDKTTYYQQNTDLTLCEMLSAYNECCVNGYVIGNNIQYQKSNSRKKNRHLQYIFWGRNRNPRLIVRQDPNLWAATEFADFFSFIIIISLKSDLTGIRPANG